MSEILIEDGDLRLRRADLNDLNYILKLQADPENSQFIVSFERDFHRAILDGGDPLKMSLVIEQSNKPCGYFLLDKSDPVSMGIWHMIVERGHKGQGLGHRALQLLKHWHLKRRSGIACGLTAKTSTRGRFTFTLRKVSGRKRCFEKRCLSTANIKI